MFSRTSQGGRIRCPAQITPSQCHSTTHLSTGAGRSFPSKLNNTPIPCAWAPAIFVRDDVKLLLFPFNVQNNNNHPSSTIHHHQSSSISIRHLALLIEHKLSLYYYFNLQEPEQNCSPCRETWVLHHGPRHDPHRSIRAQTKPMMQQTLVHSHLTCIF
jgi:hypothetical protein